MNDQIRRLPEDLVLETARLVLRVPTSADAAAMAKYAVDNKEHFAPWDPQRDETFFTEEHWREELASGNDDLATMTSLRLMLLPRDDVCMPVIGHCTFSNVIRGPFQAAHLGYGLDLGAVGKGLMEEALREAIRFCFDELNLHRIMANYVPTNDRSARLLRRLGFVREGYARDYLRIAGRWRDHVLTALVNEHWDGSRSL